MITKGYLNNKSLNIKTLDNISVFNKCRKDFCCGLGWYWLGMQDRQNGVLKLTAWQLLI